LKTITSLGDYGKEIRISPPKLPFFDIRRFEENMKTVRAKQPSRILRYRLRLSGDNSEVNGQFLNSNLFFNSPYQIITSERQTYESKVANALDKLEVQLQHNHADFSTWEEIEYDMTYMMDRQVLFDSALLELKEQIEKQAENKMQLNGINTDLVRQRVLRFGES
jgi:hypothetical protein